MTEIEKIAKGYNDLFLKTGNVKHRIKSLSLKALAKNIKKQELEDSLNIDTTNDLTL